MKRFYCWMMAAAIGLLTACATPEPCLTQVATIDALLAGLYDGTVALREFKSYGDLGIGTFDRLDGELLMLDGVVYQIRGDGTVRVPSDEPTVPFAAAVPFRPGASLNVPIHASLNELIAFMDRASPNKNIPVAVHLNGVFRRMKTRSVPPQEKPYRPLAEVTKSQPEFEFDNIGGDVVGFRLPNYMKGLNVPGWHLHFISADRTCGGHILDLETAHGILEFAQIHEVRMILPQGSKAFADVDLATDRSAELHQAESANLKD